LDRKGGGAAEIAVEDEMREWKRRGGGGDGRLTKCDSDRTPLDCYKEVEEFKNQIRRMEREFVVRTVGRDYS